MLNDWPSEAITKLATGNHQINSELAFINLVSRKVKKRVIDLKESQAESEQYNRRNNMEFSNILNDIPDNQLESKVIQIYCESSVEVHHNDIDGCHRLLV